MKEKLLSVIICTRNRADELVNCLPELTRQAKELSDVEIVIVDNGSTDGTRELVSRMSSEFGYQYCYAYEAEAGLGRARNRGRATASGEVIAYIDDDVVIRPGWLGQVREHFVAKRSDCLAGSVEVEVEGGLPEWFPERFLYILGRTELGDKERVLRYPEHPQGNNFAIRVEVFDRVGGFNPKISLYGDETEFFRRVNEHNFRILYCPEIVVAQYIPVSRITRREVTRKAYLLGRGSAIVWLLSSPSLQERALRACEYFLRTIYGFFSASINPSFVRDFTFWRSRGYLRQLVRGAN